jgi:hypothetical protein
VRAGLHVPNQTQFVCMNQPRGYCLIVHWNVLLRQWIYLCLARLRFALCQGLATEFWWHIWSPALFDDPFKVFPSKASVCPVYWLQRKCTYHGGVFKQRTLLSSYPGKINTVVWRQESYLLKESGNLEVIRVTYLTTVGSEDCLSFIKTRKSSGERRYCLHGGCTLIFPKENRAIFNGESLLATFSFACNEAQSAMTWHSACKKFRMSVCLNFRTSFLSYYHSGPILSQVSSTITSEFRASNWQCYHQKLSKRLWLRHLPA